MQLQTKQRLLGGLILLIAAVLFLPMLWRHGEPVATSAATPDISTLDASNDPVQVELKLPGTDTDNNDNNDTDIATKLSPASAERTPQVTQTILHTTPVPTVAPAINIPKNLSAAPAASTTTKTTTTTTTQASTTIKNTTAPVATNTNTHTKATTSSATPPAWTIQIASFDDPAKADDLVQKIRAQGFDVYTKAADNQGNISVRVYVGPIIDYAQVQKAQAQLKKQFNLSGIITRYQINE